MSAPTGRSTGSTWSTRAISRSLDNRIYGGFGDAGIYVGTITDTRGKPLLVEDNESDGNNRGIIIEESDSADQTIVVRDKVVSNNTATGLFEDPAGIYINSSDNGLYVNNTVNDNGAFGFDIDEPSDNNVFQGNAATGNGGHRLQRPRLRELWRRVTLSRCRVARRRPWEGTRPAEE